MWYYTHSSSSSLSGRNAKCNATAILLADTIALKCEQPHLLQKKCEREPDLRTILPKDIIHYLESSSGVQNNGTVARTIASIQPGNRFLHSKFDRIYRRSAMFFDVTKFVIHRRCHSTKTTCPKLKHKQDCLVIHCTALSSDLSYIFLHHLSFFSPFTAVPPLSAFTP